jgi:predicted NBD/HSP70 family sugar kinase
MQYYVGLDVSVKETSVCIMDKAGKVIREVKVATTPVAILAVLTEEALAMSALASKRDPYRSGCTAHWLKRVCR